jgi:hypothetical protein
MLKGNHRAARWLLFGAAVPTLVGCTLITPEWHPPRASAPGCRADLMQYCVIDNYGKRCGCAARQTLEAALPNRQ